MESKNDANYMDMGETVKARRRQVQFNLPFCDAFLRPYYLGVDLMYRWRIGFSYIHYQTLVAGSRPGL